MRHLMAMARRTMALSWRADPRATALVGVIVLFEAGALALFALTQRWVVDSAVEGTATALAAAAALGGTAYMITAAGSRLLVTLQQDLSERVDIMLNEEILTISTRLRKLEHLERPEFHDRMAALGKGTGRLAASGIALSRTAAAVLSVALSVLLLAAIHPALGLLVLLALPPIGTGMIAQRGMERSHRVAAEDERRDVSLHRLSISADSAQQIRVMGAAHRIDQWADSARRRHLRLQTRAMFAATGWRVTGWAVYTAGFAATLVIAADEVGSGTATLGGLILVATLGTRLRAEVSRAVDSILQVSQAADTAAHYVWLREYERSAADANGTRPAGPVSRIELRDVAFAYDEGAEPVLRGVNLTLEAGRTVALVGRNGAGKTTLVKLLTGMYDPTSGTILFDGAPMSELDAETWRRRTSGAFQDSMRLKTTVAEAVGVGDLEHVEDRSRIRRAIEATGTDAFVNALPDGADTLLDPAMGGQDLSGGQWQRLALARAHMREDPGLLILDEPTAALDPQAEHEIHTLYADRTASAPEQITLVVTHRFSTVRSADLIVVLDAGAVVETGSHEALMASGGKYADLYERQAGQYR